MKLSADHRNAKIHALLEELINGSKGSEDNIEYSSPFSKEEVETLFSSRIWGHREITLTIILARLMDESYKASEDFYACNPRAIYEGPIRELLRDNGIPHKKSGPLNVAKNSQKIDEIWAHNKRGDGMALVVAGLVKKIETVSQKQLYRFAVAYVHRYLVEAVNVAKLNFRIKRIEDPIFLHKLSTDLICSVPDGGAIPQLIVGLLIEHFNKGNASTITVSGHTDSVSTTNTTSGKPGDIIEEIPESGTRIYEVTVKSFSEDRMMESYEAVRDLDLSVSEVHVICRKQDAPQSAIELSSAIVFATSAYQDIRYFFIDIFEFIQEKLVLMTIESRSDFYADLVAYINRINTSQKVKQYFSEWHKQNPL